MPDVAHHMIRDGDDPIIYIAGTKAAYKLFYHSNTILSFKNVIPVTEQGHMIGYAGVFTPAEEAIAVRLITIAKSGTGPAGIWIYDPAFAGDHWQNRSSGLPAFSNGGHIAVNPNNAQEYTALLYGNGPFSINTNKYHVSAGKLVHVDTGMIALWQSADAGQSWQPITLPDSATQIIALYVEYWPDGPRAGQWFMVGYVHDNVKTGRISYGAGPTGATAAYSTPWGSWQNITFPGMDGEVILSSNDSPSAGYLHADLVTTSFIGSLSTAAEDVVGIRGTRTGLWSGGALTRVAPYTQTSPTLINMDNSFGYRRMAMHANGTLYMGVGDGELGVRTIPDAATANLQVLERNTGVPYSAVDTDSATQTHVALLCTGGAGADLIAYRDPAGGWSEIGPPSGTTRDQFHPVIRVAAGAQAAPQLTQ